MTTGVTPKAKNHGDLADLASRFVKVDEIPWEPTRFGGIESKVLYMDESKGLVTALIRMAPGAVLPEHEHVMVEQTYVLEGHLVDKEGIDAGGECGPGDFVWRPPGSRHVAWAPKGGVMIAIFQMPNKFYDQQGRVLDQMGRDWDQYWNAAAAD